MRCVLSVFVLYALYACSAPRSVAVQNRSAQVKADCSFETTIDLEARRYANVDRDQLDYQVWTAWRVGIWFPDRSTPRGTLTMVGDDITWTFDIVVQLDPTHCTLTLSTVDQHEPFSAELKLHDGVITGWIRSIDDEWLLGPPFPTHRP